MYILEFIKLCGILFIFKSFYETENIVVIKKIDILNFLFEYLAFIYIYL
jgi:hypothetical protein